MGCHFLLQGIFLTQGSNPCFLHWQANSLPPSHHGSPKLCLGNFICLFCELNLLLFGYNCKLYGASLVAQMVKKTPCQCRRCRFSPGLGRSPGGGHGKLSPVLLPGESPWAEEPGGLQSMGSQRVGHD